MAPNSTSDFFFCSPTLPDDMRMNPLIAGKATFTAPAIKKPRFITNNDLVPPHKRGRK